MVPREAARGSSFLSAGLYYLADKNASTTERVAWAYTENVPTNDPHKALKWMAWTAIHSDELKREAGIKSTGRRCERPVFTLSLSWHPEQEPKKKEMIGAGRRALIALGLEEHETLMVSHSDRPHKHLHLIVNLHHPETGKVNNLPFSRKKLSEWAEAYEREHGKIYCETRVDNNARRKKGEYVKHAEPQLDLKARITELYRQSDNGAAFQAGLKEMGLTLAQGKRLVLIDREGKIHSLSRQIDGIRAKDIRARLGDLKLPDVDTARQGVLPEATPVAKPVRNSEERKSEETATVPQAKSRGSLSPAELNRLQNRHLAELGRFYTESQHARLALAARLDQQYGSDEHRLRQRVNELQNTLQKSSGLRIWWLKVTKQIPKNAEQDVQDMRRSLENIEWRKSEAEQALRAEKMERQQAIEARHRQERRELELAEPAEPEEFMPGPGIEEAEIDEDYGPQFDL